MNTFRLFLYACLLWHFSCSSEADHQHPEASTFDPVYENLYLSFDQIEQTKIKTGKIEKRLFRQYVEATGTLHLPPQNHALIGPQVNGKIKKIHVHEGDFVKKGEILAEISDPYLIDLQMNYLVAKEDFQIKKSQWEREQQLKGGEATSEKKYQHALSDLRKSLAVFETFKAQLELLHIQTQELSAENIQSTMPILAPISGSVYRINASIGEYVGKEKILLEILNQEHLHLEILVYEKDMARIAVGQSVQFMPSHQALAKEGILPEAKIYSIADIVDTETKTVSVHAEISENTFKKYNLKSGMFTQVLIQSEEVMAYAVPVSAVVETDEGKVIYCIRKRTKEGIYFEKAIIHPRHKDKDWFWLEDIQKLDEIVLDAAFYLYHMSEEKSEIEHSH